MKVVSATVGEFRARVREVLSANGGGECPSQFSHHRKHRSYRGLFTYGVADLFVSHLLSALRSLRIDRSWAASDVCSRSNC